MPLPSATTTFGGAARLSPQAMLSLQADNTITPNSEARWDNAVTYQSTNLSGVTGKAIYANGPLNIALLYQTRQNVYPTGFHNPARARTSTRTTSVAATTSRSSK